MQVDPVQTEMGHIRYISVYTLILRRDIFLARDDCFNCFLFFGVVFRNISSLSIRIITIINTTNLKVVRITSLVREYPKQNNAHNFNTLFHKSILFLMMILLFHIVG